MRTLFQCVTAAAHVSSLSCVCRNIADNYLVGKRAKQFSFLACHDVASPDQLDEFAQTLGLPAGLIRTCDTGKKFGGCGVAEGQIMCPKTCNFEAGCPRPKIQEAQKESCGLSQGFRSGSSETSYGECKVLSNSFCRCESASARLCDLDTIFQGSVYLQAATFSFAAQLNGQEEHNYSLTPRLAFEVTKDRAEKDPLTRQLVLIAEQSGSTEQYAKLLNKVTRCATNVSNLNQSQWHWVQPAQGATCKQFDRYSVLKCFPPSLYGHAQVVMTRITVSGLCQAHKPRPLESSDGAGQA